MRRHGQPAKIDPRLTDLHDGTSPGYDGKNRFLLPISDAFRYVLRKPGLVTAKEIGKKLA
ncbi:hypothetical protein MASR1M97_19030 [Candidatus Desulfobacillus denitrificans]|uniref:Uncharacterized protein n=1 Tax=Candidatus Desulfobacillus denitrificans TaxID=2608985 RepID=A0A809S8C6_9PROT|nr:hypothetical protein DSYM_02130 [Candidatus Desulfobacillus denitrificans]